MDNSENESKLGLKDIVEDRIKDLEGLVKKQGEVLKNGCHHRDYNVGLYNGLALAIGVLTGNQPEFWSEL